METSLMTCNSKVLFIANRGEIARRIGLTAKRCGWQTATVSEQQSPPYYLSEVIDFFISIPEESASLFLSSAAMIDAARQAKATALHPGFGFLSENASFAEQVIEAGLTWVGPPPAAIKAMASKAAARGFADQAQVPCVPGLSEFPVPDDATGDFSELEGFAKRIGYPLLIKAALGGGGKGMRVVHHDEQLREAVLRARSEAQSSFGDGSLICERYLERPRHIEVQILADQSGNIVALGDRDCSIQRRHQKIIEEAPAPWLKPKLRVAMEKAAVSLAKAVGYVSAGTVEFLVDEPSPRDSSSATTDDAAFYFLEMNTRLQVEHPVTEEVFGIDLVEWQLRIATGEELPKDFSERQPRSHSIEARLYAEDPAKDFLPSPGPVAVFKPAEGPGLRWEIGLDTVDEISGRFDPMIAKLVATGSDRLTALDRLVDGLRRTIFAGPSTNIELIQAIAVDQNFRDQPSFTNFLTTNSTSLKDYLKRRRGTFEPIAEQIFRTGSQLGTAIPGADQGASIDAAIHRAFANDQLCRSIDGNCTSTEDSQDVDQPIIRFGKATFGATAFQATAFQATAFQATVNLLKSKVSWRIGTIAQGGKTTGFCYAALLDTEIDKRWVIIAGYSFEKTIVLGSQINSSDGSHSERTGDIIAPVPGKVIEVNQAVGQSVIVGQPIMVLESMKMEFEVKAPVAGQLSSLVVDVGEQIRAGTLLATIEPSSSSSDCSSSEASGPDQHE